MTDANCPRSLYTRIFKSLTFPFVLYLWFSQKSQACVTYDFGLREAKDESVFKSHGLAAVLWCIQMWRQISTGHFRREVTGLTTSSLTKRRPRCVTGSSQLWDFHRICGLSAAATVPQGELRLLLNSFALRAEEICAIREVISSAAEGWNDLKRSLRLKVVQSCDGNIFDSSKNIDIILEYVLFSWFKQRIYTICSKKNSKA